ncbi:DUF4184 family protein [Actinocorallia populi]|uniref:DUF4184 family protein n=1 Tax=Actinocorallia populi TaxID=2079200 RepID=UPI000D0928D2|nr:DUF4184 family protein [Actinocorallia populi]
MPFTLSHIAAVLPLRSRFLLPSGLVVGATVPDVPLFVPVLDRPTTHSLLGMVTWDLGMGLVLLAVFHLLLKRPLLALSPRFLRDRLTPVADGPSRRRALGAAVPSVLLGTATHVVWDAFTHLTGPAVQAFPELTTMVNGMAFYRWAQYGSGVGGALAVLVWLLWWLRRAPAVPSPGLSARARTAVLLAAVGAVGAGLAVAEFVRVPSSPYFRLRYAVTDSMVMLGCWALLYSLLYRAVRPLGRRTRAS